MEDFGSEGWLAAVRVAAEELPVVPGASVRARLEVSGVPGGPCRLGVVVSDGRLAELVPGRPAEVDCAVSIGVADARGILRGELDAAVAYMQGRLKIDGAYERVLFGLRPLVDSGGFRSFAAQVAAMTGGDCSG